MPRMILQIVWHPTELSLIVANMTTNIETIAPTSSPMSTPTRVLFLTMWYPNAENPVSGTFVHEQAEALRNEGIEVRVMQPIPLAPFPVTLFKRSYRALAALPDEESYAGYPVYHPRYLSLPGHRLYERAGNLMYRGIRRQIVNLHRLWPFDIIHAHATYPCGYAANLCRKHLLPNIKVVHTIHRTCIIDAPNYNHACFDKVRTGLEGADSNVFVSQEGMEIAFNYTQKKILGKSKYITNGVNVDKFSLSNDERQTVKELKEKHSNTWNVIFVGYLKEVKGIKELLSAIKILVAKGYRKLRLFLVGDNQLGSYIDEYLAANGITNNVVLVGSVSHEKVKIWMNFANAFILPSHSEGTPTVLFEALYVGIPSIFTKVGGVGDILTNGQEALLIEPRSVTAIEQAIETLINDSQLCAEMSVRGHALIRDQYTWALNARKHLDIYQKILN